jgi:hypothetical protein
VSLFYPYILPAVVCGATYTSSYAIICASRARLDTRIGDNRFLLRLRLRAIIAWLHILEPIARSWGHLKGGLTPWRQVVAVESTNRAVRCWAPIPLETQWIHNLRVRIDKSGIIRRIAPRLNALHCATHWNMETDEWDVRVRRGVFGLLTLCLLVEYREGGSWRIRCRARIMPSIFICLSSSLLAALAVAACISGSPLQAVSLLLLSMLFWFKAMSALARVENTVRVKLDEIITELVREAEMTELHA